MKKKRSAFSITKVDPKEIAKQQFSPAINAIENLNNKKSKKRKRNKGTITTNIAENDTLESEMDVPQESFVEVTQNAEQVAMKMIMDTINKDKDAKRAKIEAKKTNDAINEEDSGMAEPDSSANEKIENLVKDLKSDAGTSEPATASKLPSCTYKSDSLLDSTKNFCWMIHPMTPETFMEEYWEKKAVLIRREDAHYYKEFFSSKMFAEMIDRNPLEFGVNLDVTTWDKKQGRQTHNEIGRAYPPKIWDYFNNGCSVRMKNPQTYSNTIWKVCAGLQEFFGCFTGANTYLTPPASQGFAPHYDDVEVFMLQCEGRKRWKVYPPFENDELPRTSSRNYHPNEVKQEPFIFEILAPGDILYVPRGWIHQGEVLPGEHSLHVTVSTYQKNGWCDLLEKIIPEALQTAIKTNPEFRKGLPLDYKLYMGVSNSDREDLQGHREIFQEQLMNLMSTLPTYADVDKACDEVAVNDIHCSLPPQLNKDEILRTVRGTKVSVENGVVKGAIYQVDDEAEVRIVRLGSVRISMEENTVMLYHNFDNSRIYKKEELKGFEITSGCAAIMDSLIANYPEYTKVTDLKGEDEKIEDTLLAVNCLLESGVLMTRSVAQTFD